MTISTECGHCGQPIELETNRGLTSWSVPANSSPLVFSPEVDWTRFKKPHIIDDF